MALVHKVTTRNVLLLVGMSALVLVAVTRPALTRRAAQRREAWCGTYLAKTTKSAQFYYACHSKGGHWCCHPRPPTNDETEQLFGCLLSQPFVTCD